MPLEASPLPPSLLSRLESDSSAASQAIATAPLPEAVSTVRSTSDRRLLSLTSKALTTVDSLMECSDPKIRLAAASKALDLSPATKPQAASSQEASIPISAFTSLLSGLSSLFSAASPPQTRETPPRDVTPTSFEELSDA